MKSLVKRLKKYKLLYLVLLVAMAYYFVMLYIPIFWGFELSFKEMKIGSTISALRGWACRTTNMYSAIRRFSNF